MSKGKARCSGVGGAVFVGIPRVFQLRVVGINISIPAIRLFHLFYSGSARYSICEQLGEAMTTNLYLKIGKKKTRWLRSTAHVGRCKQQVLQTCALRDLGAIPNSNERYICIENCVTRLCQVTCGLCGYEMRVCSEPDEVVRPDEVCLN